MQRLRRRVYYFYGMRKSVWLLAFVLYICQLQTATAQAAAVTALAPVQLAAGEPLRIRFTEEQRIENLLVMITDTLGNTLFLDNKYRFEGEYQQSLDLSRAGKGKYRLSIIADQRRSNRDILITE
jgi:hypothetical protein